jgi:signal transduction histidine kinase
VLESNAEYAASKRIEVRQECPTEIPPVLADDKKITQVAQNLISNAIKFSPSDSRVAVRISVDDHRARVEVSDEGPGLTEDDLRRVFGKFSRLSNKPTAGEKSSGLGLHICKRLMEMQGGEIGVLNNPERGATFWISLPFA